jgi:hypothetical protein
MIYIEHNNTKNDCSIQSTLKRESIPTFVLCQHASSLFSLDKHDVVWEDLLRTIQSQVQSRSSLYCTPKTGTLSVCNVWR